MSIDGTTLFAYGSMAAIGSDSVRRGTRCLPVDGVDITAATVLDEKEAQNNHDAARTHLTPPAAVDRCLERARRRSSL